MSESRQKGRVKKSGILIVILLSFLSLELSILGGKFIGNSDDVLTDLFMRWRYRVSAGNNHINTDNLILLAIDQKSQQALGRYGAGMWLSRKPFVDNMNLLKQYFNPKLLAYDIILIDQLETDSSEEEPFRVSESPERLKAIARDLTEVTGADMLRRKTLDNINRLVSEQGNKTYANELAEIQSDELFPCLLGMNLRGGTVDPQGLNIESWSDADVFGGDEEGDEDYGRIIPYLRDMSIPASDIHFPSSIIRNAVDPSPNGNLPTLDFLDYTFLAPLNVPRDDDGVIRRVPIILGVTYRNSRTRETKEFFMPSFSLAAVLLHLGFEMPLEEKQVEVFWGDSVVLHTEGKGDIRIPIDAKGRMNLNYDNSFNNFDAVSFSRLAPSRSDTMYEKKVQQSGSLKKHIDDRMAIVGITATGFDVGATPLYSNIPLVFVQMTAINNILTQSFIAPVDLTGRALMWVILFLLVTAICHFERSFKLGPELCLFGLAYFLAAYLCVHNSFCILPVVQPVLYVVLCSFAVLSYRFFTEERAKRKIRGMFSTMVSDKVLAYLEENPQSFSLQGRNIETSVFFSDVASFTSISESLPPEKLTDLLNKYLTPVTDCIMAHGGYVDKYVGDGIMAVWGAPNPDPEHAIQACLSALEQQRIITGMNNLLEQEYGARIHVRMGINSGIVTAGNMGSERKFQYTVMGDVVNLASRLEPVNKEFGTKIIIGEATYQEVRDQLITRKLENIIVKGKMNMVAIYELIGKAGEVDQDTLDLLHQYEAALEYFHSRKWDECLTETVGILEQSQDGATMYLRERAKHFKNNPPPDSWKGEYIRTEKD